jgi:hypothetical protein
MCKAIIDASLAPIAKTAITILHYALAQKYGAPQKKLAFQASSPIKLSKGRLFATDPLFLHFPSKTLASGPWPSYVASSEW